MKAVNLGVIGCGVIGPQHMQSAVELDHVNLIAVADLQEERARETAARFNVPRYYTDPKALMDDPDVEGVVLALPAGFRIGLAIEALRRGKHVLVEKPAALDLAELNQIAEAAAAAPDRVLAFSSSRYSPSHESRHRVPRHRGSW